MLQQMTLWDTPNAISSPASVDGRSPPDSLAGPTTASCGPARARASRSASPAKAPAPTTSGICGPTCSGSLPHADLPCGSESKSQPQPAQSASKDHGSSERSKAWREKNPERSKAIARSSRLANRAGNMIADAKKRARLKGLPFDLEDFREQLTTRINSGVCELTGLPLNLSGGARDWDTPSLDRIVPALGYTVSNVRVIAFGLNVMMLTWGLDQAMAIMDALKAKEAERKESIQGRFEAALERRLRAIGSTECNLTYAHSVTPAGRRLFHVVPSMGRTVEIACGSSPTEAALWVTASARDWKDTPGMATTREDGRSRLDQLPRQVAAAMWATPTSLAPAKDGNNEAGNSAGLVSIRAHAMAALWPTPNASGFEASDPDRLLKRRQECKERAGNGNGFGLTLGQFACLEAHGAAPPGSSATTEKPGALAPEFVAWLMGFPPEWLDCAPERMPRKAKSK
jgi:hypothetical protein